MQSNVVLRHELIIGTYTERMPHVDGKGEGDPFLSLRGANDRRCGRRPRRTTPPT